VAGARAGLLENIQRDAHRVGLERRLRVQQAEDRGAQQILRALHARSFTSAR
jgi:hypothetical protein